MDLCEHDAVMIDQLDRGILQALQLDGRAPFRRIAAALGTSEQTVARRYRRLYADGVLRVIGLVDPAQHRRDAVVRPDPVPAGRRGPPRRCVGPARRRRLGHADRRRLRGDLLDPRRAGTGRERAPPAAPPPDVTGAELLGPRGAAPVRRRWRRLDGVRRAVHCGPADRSRVRRTPYRPTPAPQALSPSPLRSEDGPLLQALGLDGRASYAELARSTGWSQARVAGRLDELLTSGTIYVDVELSVELLGFGTQAYLWLTVPPDQLSRVGQALSELAEVSFVAAVTGQASLLAAVVCPDTESLYRLMTERIGGIGAVQRLDVAPVIRRVKQAGSLMDGVRLTSRIAPPRRTRPAQNGGSS